MIRTAFYYIKQPPPPPPKHSVALNIDYTVSTMDESTLYREWEIFKMSTKEYSRM